MTWTVNCGATSLSILPKAQGERPHVSSPSVTRTTTPGLLRKSKISAACYTAAVSGVFPAGVMRFTSCMIGSAALGIGLRLSRTLH